MERISSRPGAMRQHYEVIIVGSGYGGAIMASRLARAGRDVCLVERGEETLPGDFPDSILDASGDFQVHTATHDVGRRQGLFELHVDEDINVFKGCGLGGTSLINANVAIRPDPRVFEDGRWPQALRDDLDGLHRGMDRAQEMLGSTPYPQDRIPLRKTEMLERQAAALGHDFLLPPINVTFEAGPNRAGIHQPACTGCGDCVSGCNVGAKNTLLMNYLPDARRWGAEIVTGVDVRWIERSGSAWAVRYEILGAGCARSGADALTVRGDIVVVSGGTLGSTEILLRSAAHGLAVSPHVGTHFSGNGDVLGFAFDCDDEVDGIGWGRDRADRPRVGPCITGVIDARKGVPVADGIIIEEGSIPSALAHVVPATFALGEPGSDGVPLLRRLRQALSALVDGAYRGPANRTQTFLVMGNEATAGTMDLEDDRLRIRWPGIGTSTLFEEANHTLAHASEAVGGDFVPNPDWNDMLHHPLVTVHPLGGCPMGDRAETGAVDHTGAVFAGPTGTEVHEGLYVCDGAIVPRPLGVNPLLTISALAERTAALVAAAHGWTIDEGTDPPAAVLPLTADRRVERKVRAARVLERWGALAAVGRTAAGWLLTAGGGATGGGHPTTGARTAKASGPPGARPGVSVREEMAGAWTATDATDVADAGDREQYLAADIAGEAAGRTIDMRLTLASDDVERLTHDLSVPLAVSGTVELRGLLDAPATVGPAGAMSLVVADDAVDRTVQHMRYHLPLPEAGLHVEGFKVLTEGDVTQMWGASTTLHVTIHRGGPDGEVIGRGVARITPEAFARQLRTIAITGEPDELKRMALTARFGVAFFGALWHDYGTVVHRSTRLRRNAPPRVHRPLDVPVPEIHPYRTADGVDLRLTRYRGGERGPVALVHGLGANPTTYTLDTLRPNLLEYLVAEGYDVWLQEWRGSTALPTSARQFNADDVASLDHPAAAAAIRAITGRDELHLVTQCVGAVTWMMSLLGGWTTPTSVVFSQVGAHPVGPTLTKVKAGLRLPNLLHRLGVQLMTSDSYDDESLRARALDLALRFYPIPRAERCASAVCRRLAFIYGNVVLHAAVDEATHECLHELFGVTDMTMMAHVARCARAGRIVAADGADAYLPHVERARIPMTFLSGAHNAVWVPESTRRDHDWLVAALGPELVTRIVFDDHGHSDTLVGAESARDAFPAILAHLQRAGC